MLPLVPDFIRMIVVSKADLFNAKSCEANTANIEDLLSIEGVDYQSIANERNVQLEKLASESKSRKSIKKKQKKLNQLRPWEFGINDRSVILNSVANDAILNGDLMAFYITYTNDIGCIPYKQIKLLSCNEYIAAKGLFFEKYVGVSDVADGDEKPLILGDIDKSLIFNYTPVKLDQFGYEISQCKIADVVQNA